MVKEETQIPDALRSSEQLCINSTFDHALFSNLKTSHKYSAETRIYVPSCGLLIFMNFPILILLQNLIPVTIS